MAITLDGNSYSTSQNAYKHLITTPGATSRAVNFAVVRQTGGSKFANRYDITLLCTLTDIANLKTSFAKQTVGSNTLDFTDEEGNFWNKTTGSGIINTGVYFISMSEPKPMSVAGWTTSNRFLVDITLIPNATGMSTA